MNCDNKIKVFFITKKFALFFITYIIKNSNNKLILQRKSEEGKLRAQKRRKETMRLKVAQNVVKKANDIVNPLADFPAFQKFKKDDFSVQIEFRNIGDIDNETFKEIFSLLKENMEPM